MEYVFYNLAPRPSLRLRVSSPGGEPRDLEIAAKVIQGKRVVDLTGADGGGDLDAFLRDIESAERPFRSVRHADLVIWQFPSFAFDETEIDRLIDETTRNAKGLVLDLRGNGGGYVKTLERFAGRFFDREVTIANLQGRKPMKPMIARPRGKALTVPLVVLIDSRSASAAELFARLVQIEKRGTVIGDRSTGSVMQSSYYSGEMGVDRLVLYGASITEANVIMTDGKSLEVLGVTPDELIVPSGADLAAGRDPVIARAAAHLGKPLDPEVAGKLFPIEWR
jgi:C-terminal processing protease CtpA/Prc